jgi:NADH:ubiquinone oxidoreductase subunit E
VDSLILTIDPTAKAEIESQLELIKKVRNMVGIIAAIKTENLSQDNLENELKKVIIDLINWGVIGFFILPFANSAMITAEIEKSVDFMRKKTSRCKSLRETEAEEKIKELELIIDTEVKKCHVDNEEIRHALKPILHQAQKLFRCIRPCVQRLVAMTLDVPLSEVEGVVSFYAGFREKPKGEHEIIVCLGTACYVKNAQNLLETLQNHFQIEEGKVTTDGKFSFESIRCLGNCNQAPVVKIGENSYSKVNSDKILQIISRYETNSNQGKVAL